MPANFIRKRMKRLTYCSAIGLNRSLIRPNTISISYPECDIFGPHRKVGISALGSIDDFTRLTLHNSPSSGSFNTDGYSDAQGPNFSLKRSNSNENFDQVVFRNYDYNRTNSTRGRNNFPQKPDQS